MLNTSFVSRSRSDSFPNRAKPRIHWKHRNQGNYHAPSNPPFLGHNWWVGLSIVHTLVLNWRESNAEHVIHFILSVRLILWRCVETIQIRKLWWKMFRLSVRWVTSLGGSTNLVLNLISWSCFNLQLLQWKCLVFCNKLVLIHDSMFESFEQIWCNYISLIVHLECWNVVSFRGASPPWPPDQELCPWTPLGA